MLDRVHEIDRKISAAAILGVDITEVYFPERVANAAKTFGIRVGLSFDLTSGWDFNIEEHRKIACATIKEESPYLLIHLRASISAYSRNSTSQCTSASQGGWRNSTRKRRRRSGMSNSAAPCTSTRSNEAVAFYMSIHGWQDPGS